MPSTVIFGPLGISLTDSSLAVASRLPSCGIGSSTAAVAAGAWSTVTFTERGDTTLVTQNTVYQSVRDRDRALRFDMAEDIHESIERLEDLLAQLVPVS